MRARLMAFNYKRPVWIAVPAALVVVVLIVVAAFALGGEDSAEAKVGPGETLVRARIGTLATEIPVDGRLSFPNTRTLTFDSSGKVGQVAVNEGQRVEEGQILVAFDALVVADLDRNVAAQRVNAQSARGAFDSLSIARPMSVVQAEASLAAASLAVEDARELLDSLIDPDSIDVSRAEMTLADARVAADDAREFLADLIKPTSIDVSNAESRVAFAKVELDAAEDAFEDIKDGAFPIEDLRDAQNALTFAQTSLDNAHITSSETLLDWDNRIRAAQDLYEIESENYRDIYNRWLGIILTDEEFNQEPDVLFETWNADLGELFDRRNPIYTNGRPPVVEDTRWSEITVWAWLNLYPTPQLLTGSCDANEQLVAQLCIQRLFDDAFDAFDIARDGIANAHDGSDRAIASSNDAIVAAEDVLADTQDLYDEIVVDGPDSSIVEAAETRLAVAIASLSEAEDDLDELVSDIDPLKVDQSEKRLVFAEAALDEAIEDFDELVNNPDAFDVENARKRLALAETNLEIAEVSLVSARELALLETDLGKVNVDLSQEALTEALEDFEGSIIRAPFGGVVSLVNVSVDDRVNDESRVIEIVDPSVIEVLGVIDASRRSSIQVGSLAKVTVASLEGSSFDGAVTSIDAEPVTQNGVVSYPIVINVNVPAGVTIPVGLSAVTTVIIGAEAGALLVPSESVERNEQGSFVRVVGDDGLENRYVVTGAFNDSWTSIRQGLVKGDQVVTNGNSPLVGQNETPSHGLRDKS